MLEECVLRPRVVFGEAPGPNTDPLRPLFPHTTTGAAARLASLLGLDFDWYDQNILRVNALHDGSRDLELEEARSRVSEIIRLVENRFENPRFIALGAKALRCFPEYCRSLKPLEITENVLFLPHTSGANLWYNDAENVLSAAIAAQNHFRGADHYEAPQKPWAAGPAPARQITRKALYDAVMGLRASLPVGPLPPGYRRPPEEIAWLARRWLASEDPSLKDKTPRLLRQQESFAALPALTELLRNGEGPKHSLLSLLAHTAGHEPWLKAQRGNVDAMEAEWLTWYDRAVVSGVATGK